MGHIIAQWELPCTALACAGVEKATGKWLFCEFILQILNTKCNMNNRNPETDLGVQLEDQKSKAPKPLESSYLYKIFRLKESKFLLIPALYSSLVLVLKVCVTTSWPLWLTSVATGIKGVCHCLAHMAG